MSNREGKMELSERITLLLNKAIKEEKRFSQVDLAKHMEIAPASVNKWMAGGAPSLDKLPKLCEILGITPNELFGYQENETDREMDELIHILRAAPEYRQIIKLLLSQVLKDKSQERHDDSNNTN